MSKVGGIIGLTAVILVILGAIIASVTIKPSNNEEPWDMAMTMGNPEAKNHFIVYSDLVCPYCVAFENAIVENEEDFQQYIEDNDILLEVRLTDFLDEYMQTDLKHSRYSAVAAYCARNEGRFWDYYDKAISQVWNQFFKEKGKAGGEDLMALGPEYWTQIGTDIGLGESFNQCIENQDPLAEIEDNTQKASKVTNGMPYFKFNGETLPSAFDLTDGYDKVELMMEMGLQG